MTALSPCVRPLCETPPHALYLRGGPAAILYITDGPRHFESGLNTGYISDSKCKFTVEPIGVSTGCVVQFDFKLVDMGPGIGQILLEVAHYNI